MKIQFLTMPGCHACEEAKKVLDGVLPDFPAAELEIIDMTGEKGMELVRKHGIMASPGLIINGELFSTGGLEGRRLAEKLKSLL